MGKSSTKNYTPELSLLRTNKDVLIEGPFGRRDQRSTTKALIDLVENLDQIEKIIMWELNAHNLTLKNFFTVLTIKFCFKRARFFGLRGPVLKLQTLLSQ